MSTYVNHRPLTPMTLLCVQCTLIYTLYDTDCALHTHTSGRPVNALTYSATIKYSEHWNLKPEAGSICGYRTANRNKYVIMI